MLSPCKHLLRGEMLGYKSLYICKKLIEYLNVVGTLPTFQLNYINPRPIWSFGVI